jgi:hypothetical protein
MAGPLAGLGVAPAAGGLFNELAATTRRAFVPRLFVQIYFSSPTMFYMMGNAQKAAGGLNQVTLPMQGQSMVQGAYTGYGGGFPSPFVIAAIQNGQFNLAYWVVPIPLPFGETIIQATNREIQLLKARMNDAYAVTWQQISTRMFANNSGNPLFPDSFQSAFDNGTNFPTYGGINRLAAGNAAFQGQYINLGTAPWSTPFTAGATRKAMASLLTYVTDTAGGEAPTFVVMNPSDFATLDTDFIGTENIYTNPGASYTMDTKVRTAFPNLNVAGIPIFQDHFCPKGSMFGVNCKYTCMYLSEDAAFDFSGFYSLVPLGQMAQQGIVVLGYDVISAKSSSGFWAYGLTGGAF